MSSPSVALPRTAATLRWRWVVLGGGVLATLDALFATSYWRIAADLPWTRVFQSVAAGVLGVDASRAAGEPAAWLGLGLHYTIAMAFAVAYALAARAWPTLVRRPLAWGTAYGLGLYVVMNCVVVPLSAIGHMPSFTDTAWVSSSIAMHAVFGVICSLAARRALAP